MAVTELQTQKTKLVAGKVIADTTFSSGDKESAIFPLNYRDDYKGKVVFSVIEEEETNIDEIKSAIRADQENISARDNSFDERGERLKKSAQENAEEQKRRAEAKAQGQRASTKNTSSRKQET